MCILICVDCDGIVKSSIMGHNPNITLAPGQYRCTTVGEGNHGFFENISKIITITHHSVSKVSFHRSL